MNDHPDRHWLSLSDAAQYVGVHPSTLRDWTERGLVPHLRTPGGHRRYEQRDLAAFIAAQKRTSAALVPLADGARDLADRTLQAIHREPPTSEPWRVAHSPEGVERKREQGRRLLGLALRFVSRQSGRDDVLAEAEEIGRGYGRDAVADQLTLPETVRAFFYFRDSLIRATRPAGVDRHPTPGAALDALDDEDRRIHRDLRVFLDAVFYAMLGTYEIAQQAARRQP